MSASSAQPEPRIAIVLVNWNGWRECIECIDSVLAQIHGNFHIFVVDNDSRDLSIEKIASWCSAPAADPGWRRQSGVDRHSDAADALVVPHRIMDHVGASVASPKGTLVTLIRAGGNLGFAGGCNVGIKAAGLDDFAYFWFLNPDTVVERRALAELVARAAHSPTAGIIGSTLLFYDAPGTVFALAGGRLNLQNGHGSHVGQGTCASLLVDAPRVERELTWVCGASMFVSRAFVREVGLMQEDYFLYYEEADWATRGARKFRLGFAPKSVVFHKSGANSSKIMPLFTAGFYYRNRLRFMGRFYPDRVAATRRRLFREMLGHVARRRWAWARLVGTTLLWKIPGD